MCNIYPLFSFYLQAGKLSYTLFLKLIKYQVVIKLTYKSEIKHMKLTNIGVYLS